jgi:hypothetical protein
MFGKHVPRQLKGKPIRATTLNDSRRIVEQLGKLRGGGGSIWTPAGPFFNQPGIPYRLGLTGADGVPARNPSTGLLGNSSDVSDATLAITTPSQIALTPLDTTFTAYNLSGGAVGANTTVICWLLFGLWIVMWEDCASGGG